MKKTYWGLSILPKTMVLILLLTSVGAYGETVITQNGYEVFYSKKKIESHSCCFVDVTIRETRDNYLSIITEPQLVRGLSSAEADKIRHSHKEKLPRFLSGPKTVVLRDTAGNENEIDLRWAVVYLLAKIDAIHYSEYNYNVGDLILIEQPGSNVYEVKVKGMPMMIPGQQYRVYLNPTDYYEDDGLPVHSITGLSGGLYRKQGDEVYRE